MSCTDIAKYFPHFPICRGTVLAVPRRFCFGTFCPKVKARRVSTGPQPTGFGEAPQQAFCRTTAQKYRVCSHSNCLPKTQVWLHLPCLPLVRPRNPHEKRRQRRFLRFLRFTVFYDCIDNTLNEPQFAFVERIKLNVDPLLCGFTGSHIGVEVFIY